MAATGIELIQPDWPAPARVHAVATTRVGGFSTGPYASLNLGTHVGDDPDTVERNRDALARALDRAPDTVAAPRWLDQVHGDRVVDADSPSLSSSPWPTVTADAAIASAPGTICAIMTADCLPVLFADRDGCNVAAAHGGWRGLVGGILENTVNAFATRGVPPDELIAWFGPAIGPSAYEVDVVVERALRDDDRTALMPMDPEHWQLDLSALARLRLAACGVDAVFGGGLCTFAEPERFFSYRRDGVCGRQAALIWRE